MRNNLFIVQTIVQVTCGFCALMGLGQALDSKASKFDKVLGYIVCFVFIAMILFIQEVLKAC